MCNIWKHPTSKQEEFKPDILEKLPNLSSCNITGGEPFVREDLEEIIRIMKRKSKRLVISTNGYFTDRIIKIVEKNKDIGFRISLEGLGRSNDLLRGLKGGFERAQETLLSLSKMRIKDLGIAVTICDDNYKDLLALYNLSKQMKVEFATAAVHNSYYFHKYDNTIYGKEKVAKAVFDLVAILLSSAKIKDWYRAYFNYGLINYIRGSERLLPCTAGMDIFFLDPFGEIRPCNGMEEKCWIENMGNLEEKTFPEIWNSKKAGDVRRRAKNCLKNCWMIGSVSPAMKKHFFRVTAWIIKHKFFRAAVI